MTKKFFINKFSKSYLTEYGWGTGYVVITPSHPLFQLDTINSDEYLDIPVHGGITYCELILLSDIISWPSLDRTDVGCRIIGFDCAHHGDTIENCPEEYVAEQAKELFKWFRKRQQLHYRIYYWFKFNFFRKEVRNG